MNGIGIKPDPKVTLDGQSLVPILSGNGEIAERTLYWHYPHYHGSTWKPGASILNGDWKLIEFYHWGEVELYDLGADPGEQHDLSSVHPEKAAELRQKLKQWQQKTGAKMPKPIPMG